VNEHNGWVPRDFWLGVREVTFMMLDADTSAGDPCGARSEAGGGTKTAV